MFVWKTTLLLAVLSILSLTGCSSIKSSYDYDSRFDFSTIKTWQWDKQPSAEFAQSNPLVHARIVKAIEGALKQKRLNSGTPADVKISYAIRIEKKLSSSGISTGIGMSVGSSNRGHISLNSGNQLKQTTEGTLVIDVISIPGEALLWRGTATRSVSHASDSPEKSQASINEVVKKLLDNFPPSPSHSQE